MDKLVNNTYKQWLKAKSKSAEEYRKKGYDKIAAALDDCKMFSGTETITELAQKLSDPRAIEFITRNAFPAIKVWRKYKERDAAQFGVYIDAGGVTLNDPGVVYLVGDTTAEIYCRKTLNNNIILLHGATAKVFASGYSVSRVHTDGKSSAHIIKDLSAVVL